MSSRATKKRVYKLQNMSDLDWTIMCNNLDWFENFEFSKWCYKYGLINKYRRNLSTCTNLRTL